MTKRIKKNKSKQTNKDKKKSITPKWNLGFSLKISLSGFFIFFVASQAINFFNRTEETKIFTPELGVNYVEVKHSQEAQELLQSLGVNEGETFEIMSYACGACRSIDPVLNHIEARYNVPVHKFQLGSKFLPLAESEYIVSSVVPFKMKEFREQMFSNMLTTTTIAVKSKFIQSLMTTIGVTEEQQSKLRAESKEYALKTTKLADLLNINQTPTVFLKGKYKVVHSSHSSFKEYLSTVDKVLGNQQKEEKTPK